jgi:hypothetical protein
VALVLRHCLDEEPRSLAIEERAVAPSGRRGAMKGAVRKSDLSQTSEKSFECQRDVFVYFVVVIFDSKLATQVRKHGGRVVFEMKRLTTSKIMKEIQYTTVSNEELSTVLAIHDFEFTEVIVID